MDRAPAHQAPRTKSHHVRILSQHWPLRDAKGNGDARGIPDQPNPIPVRVRVVWAGGKEEWIDGMARRWTRDAVMVGFADERLAAIGVWVKPEHVKRRDP